MRIGIGYDVHAMVEGRRLVPVSYTHLDVYKRQILIISNPLTWLSML